MSRLRLSRDLQMAAGLLVILLILLTGSLVQEERQSHAPLSSRSSDPDGALALRLWLQELGYEIDNAVQSEFTIPADADLALILEPTTPVTEFEWERIHPWVEAGGTLLIAGDYLPLTGLSGLDVEPVRTMTGDTGMAPPAPLLQSPPLTATVRSSPAILALAPDTDASEAMQALLVAGTEAVILTYPRGRGRIIVSATAAPLTNRGLQQTENAALLLNLVSAVEPPATVWFDEWHHGLRSETARAAGTGFGDWLRGSRTGRALLFAGAVIFGALALAGRPFGTPIPLPEQTRRRSPLEYVRAVANLQRRAGHRQELQQHYHDQLKRTLGRRNRIDVTLPDPDFVARLCRHRPELDEARLASTLAQLRRADLTEQQMLKAVGDAVALIDR